jgi:transcriptional regulator with XRE-family HTH domain
VSIEDVVRELEARVSRLEAEAHRRAGQRKRHAARVIEAGPTEPATHDGTGLDGRCIRRARIAAGWTQGDLGVAVVGADAADRGRPTISAWERGIRRVPVQRARSIVDLFVTAGAEPPAFDFSSPRPDQQHTPSSAVDDSNGAEQAR